MKKLPRSIRNRKRRFRYDSATRPQVVTSALRGEIHVRQGVAATACGVSEGPYCAYLTGQLKQSFLPLSGAVPYPFRADTGTAFVSTIPPIGAGGHRDA